MSALPTARLNPSTGEALQRAPAPDPEAALRKLKTAHSRFLQWRHTAVEERSVLLRRAAALLEEQKERHARLMCEEMGKPIRQARAEVEKCALTCRHYADNAANFLEPEVVETEAEQSYVCFEPLGVVFAVMPWNFPFWQVFRCLAPNLMAGNAVLLKHSSTVPGCAQAIESVIVQAGFPEGLFAAVFLDNTQTLQLVEEEAVAAVTLTGSVRAGRAIAARAGQSLKKCVLELGGSDGYIVLEDADLERAARVCVHSRLTNSGQSCIAAKRFIVVRNRVEEFQKRVLALMKEVRWGDPQLEETEVGPMARVDLRDALHSQVQRSEKSGAVRLLGGEIPARPGAWYPPTVLADVRPGMPAAEEELFGPVAAILTARDRTHAVQIANATRFGLGAGVFTRSRVEGEVIARRELCAGSCFVNAEVRSDPRLPFGGIKQSGFGRELGRRGLLEFTNVKTVYVGR